MTGIKQIWHRRTKRRIIKGLLNGTSGALATRSFLQNVLCAAFAVFFIVSAPPIAKAQDGAAPTPVLDAEASPDAGAAAAVNDTQPETAPVFPDHPADAHSDALNPDRRADLPHNLSPWGMFMAADWVVKAVMIGLAFASLATWTVLLAKSVEVACAKGRVKRTLGIVASSPGLGEAAQRLVGRGGPGVFMVRAAEEELSRSDAALDYAGNEGVKERVTSHLSRIEAQAGRRLAKGTGILATIGSTAPFVGLFGTVWGIMNAFIGISEAQTTNLAVVAPGIAEALLATAIGLVAAIPAVIIYNVFARAIAGYRQLLADTASGVERLVSRDLDFRKVPAIGPQAFAAEAAE